MDEKTKSKEKTSEEVVKPKRGRRKTSFKTKTSKLSVLLRICEYLDCNIGDICDAVKDE